MSIRLLLVVASVLVLGAGGARAQQSTPPALVFPGLSATDGTRPVTEESLAAARRLIKATRALDATELSIPQMMTSMITPMARARQLSEADAQSLINIMAEEMRGELPVLAEMAARAYARRHTVSVMNAASDFYESDAGRRLAEQAPALMSDMIVVGQAWGEQIVAPRVIARFQEFTQQRGLQTP